MELFVLLRKTKIPVIAAVHGWALAGGCGLATACDIVIATESSRFGYPEVKIGFVPAMVMAILRRNVSEKKSFEFITQGFDFSSSEALEYGLINRIFKDDNFEEAVLDYVSVYEKVSRTAVILSKKLLYQMDSMEFESALSLGAEVNAIARLTEDCKTGVNKFLNKS
jgi:methylglutaconyl-CoA hydratase